jgi:hypothetical protein
LTHRKQGKAFFFEKKKQKAFIGADADSSGKVCVSVDKSFLVLFLEKGLLAFLSALIRRQPQRFPQAGLRISRARLPQVLQFVGHGGGPGQLFAQVFGEGAGVALVV